MIICGPKGSTVRNRKEDREMKILAIEASGLVAGCAVLDGEILSADYNIQHKKTHSQSLVPMMDEVRTMLGMELDTVDAIALSGGPGSFTGLRIGAATAKGLGLALNVPLIPVPTVDAIAYNLYGTDALVCPLMDARRQQTYTGLFRWESGSAAAGAVQSAETGDVQSAETGDVQSAEAAEADGAGAGSSDDPVQASFLDKPRMITVLPQCAVSIDEIAEKINQLRPEKVIFLGDGVPVFRERLKELMRVPYSFAPAHLARQRAAAVAALAMQKWNEQGEACFVPADDFRPEYLRLSQAERERAAAEAREKAAAEEKAVAKQSAATEAEEKGAAEQSAAGETVGTEGQESAGAAAGTSQS